VSILVGYFSNLPWESRLLFVLCAALVSIVVVKIVQDSYSNKIQTPRTEAEVGLIERLQAKVAELQRGYDLRGETIAGYEAIYPKMTEEALAKVAELEVRAKDAEESEERMSKKLQLSHENCACEYDEDSGVCMMHYPAKQKLDQRITALQERLSEAEAQLKESDENIRKMERGEA